MVQVRSGQVDQVQSCQPGRLRFQRGLHSLQRCFRLPCTQIPLPPHSLQITFCLPCTQRALPGVSYFKFQAKAANIQLLPQTQQSHLLELKVAVAAGMVDRNQLPVTPLARALADPGIDHESPAAAPIRNLGLAPTQAAAVSDIGACFYYRHEPPGALP